MAYHSASSSLNSSTESLPLPIRAARISSLPFSLHTQVSNEQVKSRCRELLVDYKELQSQLLKYRSKGSQLSRTNLLRLILLRFLRLRTDTVMDKQHYKKEMHQFVLRTASFGSKVLTDWWNDLLDDLMSGAGLHEQMSNVDRSVYLECISRITARREWLFLGSGSTTYSSHLERTLEYCSTKLLTQKTVPLPTSAFIGKVFAYGFFYVDDFAKLLLFALFVKNQFIENVLDAIPQSSAVFPRDKFIKSLHSLIDYTGDYIAVPEYQELAPRSQKCYAVNPPRMPSYGDFAFDMMDRPPWVKRWGCLDSTIFCSFLRHYFTICSNIAPSRNSDDFFHLPGAIILYSHINHVFNFSRSRMVIFRQQQQEMTTNDGRSGRFIPNTVIMPEMQGSDKMRFEKLVNKLPIMPYLALIRTMVYECDESLALQVVQIFENMLILGAKKINVYSAIACEGFYEVFMQLLIHLQHDSQKFVRQLNWDFWISGLFRMLNSDASVSQTRALTDLFNIWSMIPLDHISDDTHTFAGEGWISNPDLPLLYNISAHLSSKPLWELLFGHWNPIVRQFYMRLVVFKIIGSLSDSYSSYLNFKKLIKANLNATFDIFNDYAKHKEITPLVALDLEPSNPLPNKKFMITTMEPKTLTSTYVDLLESQDETKLIPSGISIQTRTVYAYDVFDDAIYSSSLGSGGSTPLLMNNLDRSSSTLGSPRGHSRSSSSTSLGRVPLLGSAVNFFKSVSGQHNTSVKIQNAVKSSFSSPLIPEYAEFTSLKPQGNPVSPISRTPPSSFSSPSPSSSMSSLSTMSDEEFKKILAPFGPSTRSVSSPSSRISTSSSTASISRLSQTTSMDALPAPPELLTKTPQLRYFRLKLHLGMSKSSMESKLRITRNNHKLFFDNKNRHRIPRRPVLPFEGPRIGLLPDQDFGVLDSDDDDEVEEFLMIRRSLSVREPCTELSFEGLNSHILLGRYLNEFNDVVIEYERFTKIADRLHNDEFAFADPKLEFLPSSR